MSEVIAKKEPAIYTAIQEGIERVNATATSNAQRVQKWVILERDFSISGGELGEFQTLLLHITYLSFPKLLPPLIDILRLMLMF